MVEPGKHRSAAELHQQGRKQVHLETRPGDHRAGGCRTPPEQSSGNDRSDLDKSTALTRGISDLTGWLGSFPAIVVAAVLVVAWAAFGLITSHLGNNTYQLIINTGTTIITFLMVFVIQNTQNRDGRALQAKMDAQNEALYMIARRLGVDDDERLLVDLVGVEDAPEHDIKNQQDEVRVAAVNHEA